MAHEFPIKEVALQAGLSLATVDRVVHQRPGVRASTRRRVEQAQAELRRQQQQVGLRGRRLLIDLVMEAPTRFTRIVRDALSVAMQRSQPAVFRARDHLAETLPVPELVAVLDAIARRGSHGVLLKAPDVPAVAEAVDRLQARGIPVVTLATDVKTAHPHPYVGLDNRCAGQTAAYLMAQWLGPQAPGQAVDVLVSSSGQRFQGEDERIHAFVQAMAQHLPACTVHVLDTGLGLYAPTVAAVGRLLREQPKVAAVYSVGGANAAIFAAFDQAQRACHPFIGHDLDDDNLALLRAGRLSAALHHDLQHDLQRACWHFMQAQGAARGAPQEAREEARKGAQAVRPSNVEVITPFNLPADVARPGI